MKHWQILLLSAVVFALAGRQEANAQSQTQSMMLTTKHNLSAAGTGSIKAESEKDICVFCHTPHVPKQFVSEQLWNHKPSTADYTLYSSEYLTSLNYTTPTALNDRSKLCLSCHDGTIAIGEVYNNEGATSISMQSGVTTMPNDAAGNLGTSLVNDHPVGFIFDNAKDPELVSRPWPWQTPVKLVPDAGTGTVECITCHDPHDNRYTKFLRMDNTSAALCTFCHNKTGWEESIHKVSTQSYVTPEHATTTIGEWACRSCHDSHGGEGVPYLLSKSEENSCFTSGCHGSAGTGANTKNIQSEYTKLYVHPTVSTAAKHKNPDGAVSLNSPNRHAECQDCHNSHQAKKSLHMISSNAVSGVLKGVRGVIPQPAPAWTQPTVFVETNSATEENQICFKCHSYYAFGDAIDGVTTILGPSGEYLTDQAMEFNKANKSAHPVRVSSSQMDGSLLPKPLTANQMTSEWSNVGTQTMYCSDCHGNDAATSSTTPQGPHGSDVRFMLTGNGKYWPQNAVGSLWSLADIKNNTNNWQNDLFCANCHPMTSGISFVNNVHDAAQHQGADVKCITCHVAVPHGAQRSRLIGYETDVKPYNYLGSGQYERLYISGFEKAASPNLYMKNNCSTNTGCHGVQTGSYEP